MYPQPVHGSNNPFAEDPRAQSVRARYPDLTHQDTGPANSPYTSWLNDPTISPLNTNFTGHVYQDSNSPQGYGYQSPSKPIGQQLSQGSGFSQPQPAYPQMFSPQPGPSHGMPFAPSSSFGQQLAAHVNSAYGGQQPQQYTGYVQFPQHQQGYQPAFPVQQVQQIPQQLQQQSAPYPAEFDPFGSALSTGGPSTPSQGPAPSSYKLPHPRDYVESHKAELEQWDAYSWKQVHLCLVALREAWETRKNTLEGQLKAMGGAGFFTVGGYGGGPAQQYTHYENLVKEAAHNIDSIIALSYQMQEVVEGYQQSNDVSSKRRVRESMNSAIAQLPSFP